MNIDSQDENAVIENITKYIESTYLHKNGRDISPA